MDKPKEDGQYICDVEFTSGCYPTLLYFRDGNWYFSESSEFPIKDERAIHRRYGDLEFTRDENNAIYKCYLQGINRDGHVWVTWTDVERLLCDLFEERKR